MNIDFDPKKNYYDILWVSEDASPDEIKKAYRKLAMKYHPDRNKDDPSAEETFKEVNEANEVLSDSSKKQQYDAFRKWGWSFWGFWWFGWWWFADVQFWWVDLWDLMWGMFGWWRATNWWPQKGEDLILQLTINFEDAYHGLEKTITYARKTLMDGVETTSCATCWGRGVVAQQVRTPFGVMQSQWACPDCQWTWQRYTKNGSPVENFWLEETKKELRVKIPAGIKSWSKIRYAWLWNEGILWWPAGDMYIKIIVRWHTTRKREWNDLIMDIDVSVFDAVLWWSRSVSHPDWPLDIKIPKWLQVWELIRVPNKWFWQRWLLKSTWDFVLVPHIKIPKRLTKGQEAIRQQLSWTK